MLQRAIALALTLTAAGVWSSPEAARAQSAQALSQLSGSGGFANVRVNNALGHAAFDYIETRWGPNSVRPF